MAGKLGDKVSSHRIKAQTPSNTDNSVVKGRYSEEIEKIKEYAEISTGAVLGMSVAMLGISGVDMNKSILNKLKGKKGQIKIEDTPLAGLKDLGIKIDKTQFKSFYKIEAALNDLYDKFDNDYIEDIKALVEIQTEDIEDMFDIMKDFKSIIKDKENESPLVRLEERDINALVKAIKQQSPDNKEKKKNDATVGIEFGDVKDITQLIKELNKLEKTNSDSKSVSMLQILFKTLSGFDIKSIPDSKQVKEISSSIDGIISMVENIGSFDKKKAKESIKTLKWMTKHSVGSIKNMLEEFDSVAKNPNTLKSIASISILMQQITQIGNISREQRKEFSKNIQFLSCIFGSSSMYPGLGLSQLFIKGIIPELVEQIQSTGNKVKEAERSIEVISKMFEKLSKVSTALDHKDMKKTSKAITTTYNLFGKNGSVDFLLQSVKKMLSKKDVDDITNKIESLTTMLSNLTEVANDNSLKKVLGLKLSISVYKSSVKAMSAIIDEISENLDDKKIETAIDKLDNLKLLFIALSDKDMKVDVKPIISSLWSMAKVSLLAMVVSVLSNPSIAALDSIYEFYNSLSSFVDKINSESIEVKDIVFTSLSQTQNAIIELLKIAGISIVASPFIMLSLIGLPLLELEVKSLSKLIVKLNEMEKVNDLKALDDAKEAVIKLSIVAGVSSIALPFIALSLASIPMMGMEVKSLSKLIVKLNEMEKVNDLKALDDAKEAVIKLSIVAGVSSIALPFIALSLASIPMMGMEVKSLSKLIVKLNEMEKVKNAKKIDQSIEIVKKMAIMSALAGAALPLILPALISIPAMSMEVTLIQGLLTSLSKIKVPNGLFKKVKSIYKIVMMCSGMMLAASVVGMLVIPLLSSIMAFSVAIGTFILATIGAINIGSKGMKHALKNVKGMCMLIAVSGVMMMLGAAVMNDAGMIAGALSFAIILGGFIWLVTKAYTSNKKRMAMAFMEAAGLALLVVTSGVILMVGAKLISDDPMMVVYALAFGLILGGFIWLVTKAYTSNMKRVAASLIGAIAVSMLIVVSGVMLLVAGKIIADDPKVALGALAFGVILGAFIWAVTKAYTNNTKGIAMSLIPAVAMGILIVLAGATLLVGGYLIADNPWMAASITLFGVILGAFIFAITKIYQSNTKGIANSLVPAVMMAVLIVVASGALLYAGKMMTDNPNMRVDIPIFTGCVLALVGGMAAVVKILGMMDKKSLIQGGIALAGIEALIWALGYAMKPIISLSMLTAIIGWDAIIDTLKISGIAIGSVAAIVTALGLLLMIPGYVVVVAEGAAALAVIEVLIRGIVTAMKPVIELAAMVSNIGWDDLTKTLEMSGVCIGATAAVVTALGALMVIPGFALVAAGGAAALATIGALIVEMANVVKQIAVAAIFIKTAGDINEDLFIKPFSAMKAVVKEVASFGGIGTLIKIKSAQPAVHALAVMISEISQSISDMANLKVPIYGDDGKVKTYRQLQQSDFELAAVNVSAIVTCLGGAVIDVYEKNPDMFGNLVGNAFGVDTPFDRTVKSCTGLGKMIAKIAEGVKDMAELKVPIYEGKDIKGYRSLNSLDFINAALNTKTIISVLGQAVMDMYNGKGMSDPKLAQAMFHDDSWLGTVGLSRTSNTPFAIVVKACTGLGNMIGGIAEGVKAMAELKVPIYEGSEIKSYCDMTQQDFDNAAKNTALIVSVLGNAIMTMYNDPNMGYMFHDESLIAKAFGGSASRTPFGIVMGCLSGIGELMSSAVKSIQDVLNMTIPEYDSNGRETGKKIKFNLDQIKEGGRIYTIVQDMLKCIPKAIIDTYNSNKDIFEDGGFLSGLFGKDAENTPFFITKSCIEASIPLLDKARSAIEKVLKIEDFNPDEVNANVSAIISAIPEAIISNTWEGTEVKEMYKNTKWLNKVKSAFNDYSSILVGICKQISPIIKELSNTEVDTDKVFAFISKALTDIPSYIYATYTNNQALFDNKQLSDSILDSFDIYGDVIDSVTSAYSKINKVYKRIFDSTNIEEIIGNISSLTDAMFKNVSFVPEYINDDVLELLNVSFVEAASSYKNGVNKLADAIKCTPDNTQSIDLTSYMIHSVSDTIASVKESPEFTQETKDTDLFVKSLNSLDTNKAQVMTNLVTALDKMATRLGGLDKLTKELSDDLSVVLKHLTNELKASAKTIDTAEKIQKKRHEQINKSISEISKLMQDPLKVIVEQSDKPSGDNSNTNNDTKQEKSTDKTNGTNNFNVGPRPTSGTATEDTKANSQSYQTNTANSNPNNKDASKANKNNATAKKNK